MIPLNKIPEPQILTNNKTKWTKEYLSALKKEIPMTLKKLLANVLIVNQNYFIFHTGISSIFYLRVNIQNYMLNGQTSHYLVNYVTEMEKMITMTKKILY